jgi:hypothetical protein
MLLYISGDGGASLCMSDGSFVRILPAPAPSAPAPSPDGLVIDHLAIPPQDGSGAVTFVEGRVGSAVTGAALTLDDGTQVTVTVGGGHFIAWWPSSEGVATSTETTAAGRQSGPAEVASDAMPHPCPSGTAPCNRIVHVLDGSAPPPQKGG